MGTQTYKCPGCGAGIHFKPALGLFKCDYCLGCYTEAELTRYEREKERVDVPSERDHKVADGMSGESPVYGYHCDNCGATVEVGDQTTATFCYYCHNSVVITDRLSGTTRPQEMIPFQISREQAEASYRHWVSKHRYVPRDFVSKSTLDYLTGVYLPYWYVDVRGDVQLKGQATIHHSQVIGQYRYHEEKTYRINRDAAVVLNDIVLSAYSRFDNDLIYSMMPFDTCHRVPFSKAYLSGFFAESCDRTPEDWAFELQMLVRRSAIDEVTASLGEYTGYELTQQSFLMTQDDWRYVLLPMWVLTYRYQGIHYVFAINGETGKVVGELPLDVVRVVLHALMIAGIVVMIAFLLGGLF